MDAFAEQPGLRETGAGCSCAAETSSAAQGQTDLGLSPLIRPTLLSALGAVQPTYSQRASSTGRSSTSPSNPRSLMKTTVLFVLGALLLTRPAMAQLAPIVLPQNGQGMLTGISLGMQLEDSTGSRLRFRTRCDPTVG